MGKRKEMIRKIAFVLFITIVITNGLTDNDHNQWLQELIPQNQPIMAQMIIEIRPLEDNEIEILTNLLKETINVNLFDIFEFDIINQDDAYNYFFKRDQHGNTTEKKKIEFNIESKKLDLICHFKITNILPDNNYSLEQNDINDCKNEINNISTQNLIQLI